MSLKTAFDKFESALKQAEEWFVQEIAGFRTGRVKPNIVDGITVEHYGTRTPLQGLASIGIADARTIVITPWDASAITAIEKAITAADLGALPIVDGKILRLSFPSLSEEMREQTVKQLHKKAEEARVRCRKARDESLSMIKNDKQNSDITEDDFYEGKAELDKMIDKANTSIAAILAKKEQEIRTI